MEQRWTVGVLPGAWAGSSGCPQAVAEARPAVRNLSGGACCPQLALVEVHSTRTAFLARPGEANA